MAELARSAPTIPASKPTASVTWQDDPINGFLISINGKQMIIVDSSLTPQQAFCVTQQLISPDLAVPSRCENSPFDPYPIMVECLQRKLR